MNGNVNLEFKIDFRKYVTTIKFIQKNIPFHPAALTFQLLLCFVAPIPIIFADLFVLVHKIEAFQGKWHV